MAAPVAKGVTGKLRLVEFVEPEDESGVYRSPLHPDDRLWRHPSEMAGPPSRRPSRSTIWMVAAGSALGAGLLSTGLVLIIGALLLGDRPTKVIEREMVPRSVAATVSASDLSGEGVIEVARRVQPAVAQLRIGMSTDTAASAVLFRSDGHLLTSAQVVKGAPSIRIRLSDGRELPARLVGSDADTDIAVVKIEGGPFPVVTLGTAGDLRIGQATIAVGSPVGPGRGTSVSLGVVSGLHHSVRSAAGPPMLYDMVQTDASIASRCPGAALFDTDGSVVAISAAVATDEQGDAGLGFATPIELAHAVATQIIDTGAVQAVWLGVQGEDLDGSTATAMQVEGGAVVAKVTAGGPAQRAGIVDQDVIVAVNGTRVTSMGQLVAMLRRHRPGDAVTLEVVRSSEARPMSVTLAARPQPQ